MSERLVYDLAACVQGENALCNSQRALVKHYKVPMCVALTVHSSSRSAMTAELKSVPASDASTHSLYTRKSASVSYSTNALPFVVQILHVEAGSIRREAAIPLSALFRTC